MYLWFQRSEKLFDMNLTSKGGSAYLQGKVVTARKVLEEDLKRGTHSLSLVPQIM